MVFVLIGVMFSMWVAIEQLVVESPKLAIGLYALFTTVGLTGIGGVLFIIREIEHISGLVITGVPVGMVAIGISMIILPTIISQLSSPSVDIFLAIIQIYITIAIIVNAISEINEIVRDGIGD